MYKEVAKLSKRAQSDISKATSLSRLRKLRIAYLGRKGKINKLLKRLILLPQKEKSVFGKSVNTLKETIETSLQVKESEIIKEEHAACNEKFFDVTKPGKQPMQGHLHLITQAIEEIRTIFERIGFTFASYPEVEYDWYAFESLNMPANHPARDEWETFFVDLPPHAKYGKVVLTPHTTNGQIREMERLKKPPIRMINIGKTYRRQSDVSHSQFFHQFDGLAIEKGLCIGDLKGVIEYFVKEYFGPCRQIRLRPYDFTFTEPSFEIDVTCGVCDAKGCRLCKEGWLELGGSGMTHPTVLRNGGIDPDKYSGIAFGWGVERVLMMREGLNIPDLRLLYSSDIRFLQQF